MRDEVPRRGVEVVVEGAAEVGVFRDVAAGVEAVRAPLAAPELDVVG
jgi:hypothetical protein